VPFKWLFCNNFNEISIEDILFLVES